MVQRRSTVWSGLIIALACFTFGAFMVTQPERFVGRSYEVMFETAGPDVWGVGFCLAAAVYVMGRRPPWQLGMMFMTLAFTLCIGAAVWQGKAGSPVGWVWPGCVAALLVVSGYRGGR